MTPTSNRAQHQHQTQYITPDTLIIGECIRPAKPKLQGADRQIGPKRSIKTCLMIEPEPVIQGQERNNTATQNGDHRQ